ncbi:MAG: hypothetical protein N2Z70_01490 [Bdellovibrionaceae bacterium]|jgi:hypothetical protein|nr:hypothetical protein [Pseudobdellovibrionaceae bacterium]
MLKKPITKGLATLTAGLALWSQTPKAQAQVWVDTQTWDERWEQVYAEWVRTQFNEDIFLTGKWGNMATDCADAVYAARLIFAYEHKLPFALKSTGQTNRSARFNHISDEVRRVRAFMNDVFGQTSTKTLPVDTYPIEISRRYLTPGAIWLRNSHASENFLIRLFSGPSAPSGHTEVVKDVTASGVVYLIGSTVPIKVRPLLTVTSLAYLPETENLGFRRFIWPQNLNAAISANPGYSKEQFKMGVEPNNFNNDSDFPGQSSGGRKTINQFTKEVQERLALQPESKEEYAARLAKEVCAMMHLRKEVVQDAIRYKNTRLGGACFNQSMYDNFSTPSRDRRIKQVVDQVYEALFAAPIFVGREKREQRLNQLLDQCQPITLTNGQSYRPSQLLVRIKSWSNNPNDSELARWGIETGGNSCPKY